ncbi:MAG TPA: hypothetical protein VIL79_01175 [Thermoleophilia bacterium]
MKRRGVTTALTALAALALSIAVLVPAAIAAPASPAATAPTPQGMMGGGTGGGSWCGGGIWNGSGQWGGTGMWGTGYGAGWLAKNPAAFRAWLQLKADHIKAMQTWQDTYKADLTTPAAQQALHGLWTKFWNDMKSFYKQYGNGAVWTCPSDGMWSGWDMGGMMGGHEWDVHHMWGTGYGAAWMTSHRGAFGHWLTMRGHQTADVAAWRQHYNANPGSSAAQTALQTLRAHHRTQVKSFYRHHHLSASTSRMRYGAGGWMGLGGMWGGWGW